MGPVSGERAIVGEVTAGGPEGPPGVTGPVGPVGPSIRDPEQPAIVSAISKAVI
jgi:hypothetical protein